MEELTIARIGKQPANRSAHAAIKGYEYQFDRTVLEILAAAVGDEVHIEGIEDVDLFGAGVPQAIQVKYFEAQRYTSPKSLRDPIKLMLDHYRTGARWSYVLHVHFGEPGELPLGFTLEQLKICLTKRDQKEGVAVEYFAGVDDSELLDFCSRVSIRSGVTFDDQQDSLMTELAGSVGCGKDEVEAIYLAKARDFVRERARSADPMVRAVSRNQLLAILNVRELLFSKWQLASLGEEKYLRIQVTHLKRNGFADTRRLRAMSIDLSDEIFETALAIAKDIASAHIGRLKNAKPWAVILTASPELLRAFKVDLIRSGIDFNDGYEAIEFSAEAFSRPPVINVGGATDKLTNSSYVLRVVSDSSFSAHLGGWPKLGRLIVLGEKVDWHDEAADAIYVLRKYEPGMLRALMGEVA